MYTLTIGPLPYLNPACPSNSISHDVYMHNSEFHPYFLALSFVISVSSPSSDFSLSNYSYKLFSSFNVVKYRFHSSISIWLYFRLLFSSPIFYVFTRWVSSSFILSFLCFFVISCLGICFISFHTLWYSYLLLSLHVSSMLPFCFFFQDY